MTEYELYQLEWMIDHGHSLGELMDELTYLQNDLEQTPGVNLTVRDVFDTWAEDRGFGGEVYACEAEYRKAEGKGMAKDLTAAVGGHTTPSFDRDLIEKGLEQGVIHQVFGEGFTTTDTEMTVAIGEHYLIIPRQDPPADAITAQLEEMAGSDETYFKDKLAYIVSFLHENTLDVPTVSFESGLGVETYTLALYLDRYQSNGNLALAAIDVSEDSEDFGEQWGCLTVNLPNDPVAASWCAQDGNIVLDTNNTSQNLEDALVDAGVIEFTGEYVRSGFCSYPLAIITPEAMSNLRGFRETADRILAERQEAEFQQAYDQDRDTGVSLKGEAETMRESANQLAGGDTSLKPDPER